MRKLWLAVALVLAMGAASAALASTTPAVERLAGANRYDTAVVAAHEAFPDGCGT
ncbi:MAG: cell wall-binding repeat-containing protein, partial [Actinobacteria bacterium]